MKHLKNIFILFILSISFSCLLYIIETDSRVDKLQGQVAKLQHSIIAQQEETCRNRRQIAELKEKVRFEELSQDVLWKISEDLSKRVGCVP
jgi:predicted Holliday junction resolvase-like endonuclease